MDTFVWGVLCWLLGRPNDVVSWCSERLKYNENIYGRLVYVLIMSSYCAQDVLNNFEHVERII